MKHLVQKTKPSSRFHQPLDERDSDNATWGCRHSNPDICKNHSLYGKCAFIREDNICLLPPTSWKQQFVKLSIQTTGEK